VAEGLGSAEEPQTVPAVSEPRAAEPPAAEPQASLPERDERAELEESPDAAVQEEAEAEALPFAAASQ